MMIFWWTGKGWKAAGIPLFVLTLVGLPHLMLRSYIGEAPWLWSIGLIISAGFVWRIGTSDNRKAIARKSARNWRERLFYKARNRFFSIPTETWAFPLAATGLVLAGQSLIG